MLQHSLLKIVLAGLVFILLISFAPLVHAAGILYAKQTVTGAGDCTSWANACVLQTALAGATLGDEIWVAVGAHKPTTDTDRNATFQLKTGVAVYGGFVGTETTRAERDWKSNSTTLSGDIGAIGTKTDNSYHVVTGSGADSTAVLDGFTITGGYASSFSSPTNCGGGLYNVSGSPTLANLIFDVNYAWKNGGGMYTDMGNPTLTNIAFTTNTISNGGGGGLYNTDGAPSLTDVTFDGNVGGMSNWSGNSTLVNVTFTNNRYFGGGGGLSIFSSSPTLTNVTFYNNSTTGTLGGAIYSSNSSPTFYHVTVFSNTAPSGGGLYVGGSGAVLVHNSILWNNATQQVTKGAGSTATISITYSVLQNGCPSGVTCTNPVTTNPNLGSLSNNGGNTQTIPLLSGSSAIDTVPTGVNGCGTTLLTDQRGVTRPQGSACDAGAFEVQSEGSRNIYIPLVVRR